MSGTCIDLSTLHPQSLPHLRLVPHSPHFFPEGLRNSSVSSLFQASISLSFTFLPSKAGERGQPGRKAHG